MTDVFAPMQNFLIYAKTLTKEDETISACISRLYLFYLDIVNLGMRFAYQILCRHGVDTNKQTQKKEHNHETPPEGFYPH